MKKYARIAVPIPLRAVYHYGIPERLADSAVPGARVLVEFSGRKLMGLVVSLEDTADVDASRVKPVVDVLDPAPLLDEAMLSLGEWLSEYYHHPLGETLWGFLPPSLRTKTPCEYAPLAPAGDLEGEEKALYEKIAKRGRVTLESVPVRSLGAFVRLIEGGYIEQRFKAEKVGKGRWLYLTSEAPNAEELGLASLKLAKLLDLLKHGPKSVGEAREQGVAADTVKRAMARGWVEMDETPPQFSAKARGFGASSGVELNHEQSQALGKICSSLEGGEGKSFLLHGVTGSGKTEVYIRAAQKALSLGKPVIILAPEIALTPQLIGRFSQTAPGSVAVLHSGLTDREREDQWRGVREGRLKLVIGTRSAILAPVSSPGLIVVDEEHDQSYKQEEGLRYNAKHLALVLAKRSGATVVLGSATPDVEDYFRAKAGHLELLELNERATGAYHPRIEIIDLRPEDSRRRRITLFGEKLVFAVTEALGRGEQALIFHNRRGISPVLYCPSCEEAVTCRQCSVSMTLHGFRDPRLLCHYCGLSILKPERCPKCGGASLIELGAGTQKLEAQINETWPHARVLRLDRDSSQNQRDLLKSFAEGEADILVGTQMIAKGHHFPKVTVVGVISADDSMHLPDFRSTERTYQLITQVAGRAGREELRGTAYVQTRNPHHPVLLAVAKGDYKGFVEEELGERKSANYPPYCRVALVRVSARDYDTADVLAADCANWLYREAKAANLNVMGPAPSPIERVRGRHRRQILVRAPLGGARVLKDFLEAFAVFADRRAKAGETVSVDVDPMTLF